jgi:hypothetical protein
MRLSGRLRLEPLLILTCFHRTTRIVDFPGTRGSIGHLCFVTILSNVLCIAVHCLVAVVPSMSGISPLTHIYSKLSKSLRGSVSGRRSLE